MRIGAIFARGSCRALKWTALLGVLFALGAVEAAAQITVNDAKVQERGVIMIPVTVTGEIAAGGATATTTAITVTATQQADGATADIGPGDPATTVTATAEGPDINLQNNEGGSNSGVGIVAGTLAANTHATDAANRTTTVNIRVEADRDTDAEDEIALLAITVTGVTSYLDAEGASQSIAAVTIRVDIDDFETQTYEVALADANPKPVEGTPFNVTVSAVPPHEDDNAELQVFLQQDSPRYEVSGGAGTGTNRKTIGLQSDGSTLTNSDDLIITGPANDGDRVADPLTVRLFRDPEGGAPLVHVKDLEVSVADGNVLPNVKGTVVLLDADGDAVDPQPDPFDSVDEGDMVELTVTVIDDDGDDLAAVENLTIELEPTGDGADATDYRLSKQQLAIATGAMTDKVTVTITEDVDVNPEMLMLSAVVSGVAANGTEPADPVAVLSLDIVDQTPLNVQPMDQTAVNNAYMMARTTAAMSQAPADLWTAAGDNPDDAATIMLSDLFMLPDASSGLSLSVTASSDNEDAVMVDADASMVTLTPMSDGTANVKVVVTTFSTAQVSQNTATVDMEVMVDKLPPVVTVTTDPTGSVDEGGTFDVIATLNQDAPYDKAITLQVRGPVVGGADHMVTIPEGMRSGTVMLTVMNDNVVEAMSDIVIVPTFPADPDVEVGPTSVVLSVVEDDMATSYELSFSMASVMEGSDVTITATASPAVVADTTIDLVRTAASTADEGDYSLSAMSISIAAGGTSGEVTLTATDDDLVEDDEMLMLDGMVGDTRVGSATVTIESDDVEVVHTYELAISAATVMEGGDVTITATVDPAVDDGAEISLVRDGASSASTGDYSLSAAMISIAAGGTSGEVTLTATDDDLVEDDEMLTLHGMMGGTRIGSVEVTIESDDVEVVHTYELSAPATATEGDEVVITATADPAVEEAMTVDLVYAASSTLGLDQFTGEMSITIAAGATSGSTTLTITQDYDVEADATLVLVGSVGGTVSIAVSDDDEETTYSLAVTDNTVPVTSLTEGDDPVTVTVTASQMVREATTVMVMAGTGSEADASDFSVSEITIPAMDTEGVGVLTINDDLDVEGAEMLSLVAMVGDAMSAPVMITVMDNDVATTFSLMASASSVMEGGEVTITATATQAVRGNTEISLMRDGSSTAQQDDDYTLNQGGMITIMDGQTEGSVTLTAVDDEDVEGTESVTLNGGMDSGSVTIEIMDNDEETVYTYSLSADPASATEGDEVTITATASSAVEADTMVMLTRDATSTLAADQYTGGMSITIANGMTTGTTTLTITEDYDVEADAMLMLSGNVGAVSAGSVTIMVTDNDMETTYTLTITDNTVPVTSLTEGDGAVTVTVTASQMMREATMVQVVAAANSQADASDFTATVISIATGGDTGVGTLTITDDHDVEGTEVLSLVAMVGDAMSPPVMITVMDNDMETTYSVSASAATVMEGGEITITATANQPVRGNKEVMLMRDGSSMATEGDDYTLSVPLITIMDGMETGSLTLMAVNDNEVEEDETLTLNATVDGMSAGMVTITIQSDDVDSAFTLSGPMDMNLVEGSEYTLTVTADPAVTAETTVTIMRDRALSDADDSDFTVAPVVIAAGETTGTTMLMVTEDNMDDAGHGMPEMLALYGMAENGMQTNTLSFYTWDMAVPALPVIAQLLLAAFLAIGGCRRFRRR